MAQQSGEDVTRLMNQPQSGEDVTDLMNQSGEDVTSLMTPDEPESDVEGPGLLGSAWDWLNTPLVEKYQDIDPLQHDLPLTTRVGAEITKPISLVGEGLAGLGMLGGLRKLRGLGKAAGKVEDIPTARPRIPLLEQKAPLGARPSLADIDTGIKLPPREKLRQVLRESKKPTKKQLEINRLERLEKFTKARRVQVRGEKDVPGFMAQFKGRHPKVVTEPIRPELAQDDIDSLFKQIGEVEDMPEQIKAHRAFYKLLDTGEALQNSEREVLERVFGKDVVKSIPKGNRAKSIVLESLSLAKGMKAMADVSFMLRQGINHAGRKAWRKAFVPMLRAYGAGKGEQFYQTNQNLIRSAKNYKLKQEAGLAFTDLKTFEGREEAIMSTWTEKLPGIGKVARASNRSFTLAANIIRDGAFDTLYDDYARYYNSVKKLAQNADELKEAELFNPDSLYRAKKIAEEVNVSTGRGKLGKFEAVATELNAGFFAPRLMSARVRSINRVFNPFSYIGQDPVVRREHLRQMRSIVGVAMGSATLFKMAGADVSLDPNSSDFLKVKIGDTRLDMMAGYQQYFVPFFKVFANEAVSTRTGEPYTLGEGMADDAMQVLIRGVTNKASPLVGLGATLIRREDPVGRPVDLTSLNPYENTVMNTFTPMITEDLMEMIKGDPTLIPLLLPLSALGAGVQVHER